MCVWYCSYCTVCRFVEWVFGSVQLEELTDDMRAVYLRGLREALVSEGGKSPHGTVIPVSQTLHTHPSLPSHTYTHSM